MSNSRISLVAAVSALAVISACQRPEEPAASNDTAPVNNIPVNEVTTGAATAHPRLIDASGNVIGRVEVSEDANGVNLRLTTRGLPAGTHGVHLHEKGICDQPFESAGAHWNPSSKQHGRNNPRGPHLGDVDNVDAPAGSGFVANFTIAGASISGAGDKLADADGTSLVIHAAEDDYATDPSGNSGDRIACAVLARPSD